MPSRSNYFYQGNDPWGQAISNLGLALFGDPREREAIESSRSARETAELNRQLVEEQLSDKRAARERSAQFLAGLAGDNLAVSPTSPFATPATPEEQVAGDYDQAAMATDDALRGYAQTRAQTLADLTTPTQSTLARNLFPGPDEIEQEPIPTTAVTEPGGDYYRLSATTESADRANAELSPELQQAGYTAGGRYGFTDPTWRRLGMPGSAKDATPEQQDDAMRRFTQENGAVLEEDLGRTPVDWEVRTAHRFGADGAKQLLSAREDARLDQLFGADVMSRKANPDLFEADGTPKTVGRVLAETRDKFGSGITWQGQVQPSVVTAQVPQQQYGGAFDLVPQSEITLASLGADLAQPERPAAVTLPLAGGVAQTYAQPMASLAESDLFGQAPEAPADLRMAPQLEEPVYQPSAGLLSALGVTPPEAPEASSGVTPVSATTPSRQPQTVAEMWATFTPAEQMAVQQSADPETTFVKIAQDKEAAAAKTEQWQTVPDPRGGSGQLQFNPRTGEYRAMPKLETGGAGEGGPFAGTGIDASSLNNIYAYQTKKARGAATTGDEDYAYQLAKYQLEQPKLITGADKNQYVMRYRVPEIGSGAPVQAEILDQASNTWKPVGGAAAGGVEVTPLSTGETPAETERKQKETKQRGQKLQQAGIVTQDIGRALDIINNSWLPTTGWGAYLKDYPGPAKDLAATLDSVKANVGFERLQQMREASPTGGALGNVSERENVLLQSVQGSLDQAQSREQLVYNLERLDRLTRAIVNGVPQPDGSVKSLGDLTLEEQARVLSGGAPTQEPPATQGDAGGLAVGAVDQGYVYQGGDPNDPSNWKPQ